MRAGLLFCQAQVISTKSTMQMNDFIFDERVERAATLPSNLYRGEAVLEQEKSRIFNRTWQLAGRVRQLPEAGSFFTLEVAGEPVVIVRGRDEKIRGFFNVCRHRAGPVAQGAGCRSSLQCAYHGWTYALDGKLLATPAFEGVECFNKSESGLLPVKVELWEQFIFINLDSMSAPLTEYLGDLPELTRRFDIAKMKFVERREYLIDCNWKVYVDNFLEGYHLPMVHPGLMRELDFANYRTITHRYFSLQDAPIRKSSGNEENRYYASDSTTEALYFWVFPNLMVNINPETLSTNLIIPLSPEKTLTIFEWFAEDVESEEARKKMLATIQFSDEVQQEDITICEAVQRGLRSVSYDRGRYSVRFENGLHHFHGLWREFCSQTSEHT
jgi:choline monooxygenase